MRTIEAKVLARGSSFRCATVLHHPDTQSSDYTITGVVSAWRVRTKLRSDFCVSLALSRVLAI